MRFRPSLYHRSTAADWVHAYVAGGLAILYFRSLRTRMHAMDGPECPVTRPSHKGQGIVRLGSRNDGQRALPNVEEQLHAALRPRSTTSRDAARLAELRRSLRTANSRAQ